MKRSLIIVAGLVFAFTLQITGAIGFSLPTTGAHVDPLLSTLFSSRPAGATATVVITYNHQPGALEFARLSTAGITRGYTLRQLPMIITNVTETQLAALRTQPGVVSVWSNRVMQTFTNASRPFIGVNALKADSEVTGHNTANPGFPISGKGIGIGYVDTGVDATNADLKYGTKVLQNVIQPLAEGVISGGELGVGAGVDISDNVVDATGFSPPLYVENQQFSDVESGHGTFGAGVAAGLGMNSGGFYGGVALGAHLVVVNSGTDSGLPLVAILGAYDYLLVNQVQYNIRVINNSWGSSYADSEIAPDNPINVATRTAHDRNITVVFAAGNAGTADDAINPYSTMAWTISVAAGEKQGLGTPADFSSRGKNNGGNPDIAGMPADPNAPPNLRPDLIGSGVDIKSVRSHGPGLTNVAGTVPVFVGSNDLTTISPAFLPFYTTSQGTSFSCPQVSGVVALMLEGNPTLTPDDIVTLLRQTATPMPYEEKVVGAGYVDAHNAVRAAMGLARVAHPFDLFPHTTGPQIVDAGGDQLGTGAQDILSAQYAYDADHRQIVYTLTLADMSQTATNMEWLQESNFGNTTVYVSTAIDITGTTFSLGKIVVSNNVRQQTTIGGVDSGVISGNQIIIRVSVDQISAAVGYDIVGTTSTGTQALSQILVGADGAGLLLAADTATGSDFKIQ